MTDVVRQVSKLMGECRANGKGGNWHPEAIEQQNWVLANGEGKERLLAWVKLHSIVNGSACCVDYSGNPLTIASAAADLGIAFKTAEKHVTALVAEGRIRLKKTRLYYRADVPENQAQNEAANSPGEEDEKPLVQEVFPAYLVDFIESLNPEKQAEIRSQKIAFDEWQHRAFLEGLAVLRHEISRVELTMYRRWGAPKIVLAKTAAVKPQWFQLSLLAEPDFVQTPGAEAVSKAVYKAQNGNVQSGASLLSSDRDLERSLYVSKTDNLPTNPPDFFEGEVAKILQEEWRSQLPGIEPKPKLCRQILEALKGAPLDWLRQELRRRARAATSMGFALSLAVDVGRSWLAQGAALAAAGDAAKQREAAERAEHEREWRRVLADPKASHEERQLARELLGEQSQTVGAK